MKKLLPTLLSLLLFSLAGFSQVVYEDFENGGQLTWQPFGDGVYNGIVANPTTDGINMSANCGSYTKSDMHAYSLFITELASPMDLSTNNEFHIMINAPVASKFIFKLEGTGEALEKTQNIAVTDKWVDYTFDMSAAKDFTTITKIIIFFDYGNETSGDTYLFDNIIAYPEGPCAGTTPDPQIIDNFECQRNATYGIGFDRLTAVANPDPSGINTSSMVGRYEDATGPGTAWEALVVDYDDPIDLSENNYISMKVWSPKQCRILFKLEGGPVAKEVWVDVTETNKWVEYGVDFSDQALAVHRRIVFFLNGGEDGEPGDVYYIDDIKRTPVPAPDALEDFEDGQDLFWEPLSGNTAVNGVWGGDVPNPDASGANTSDNVGKYTRAASQFSALSAILGANLDLSTFPQMNLDVWAPAGATTVRMQLVSATQGSKDVDRTLSGTEAWETVSFDFSNFSSITDFSQINILFDPGTTGTGMYFIDNLRQSGTTIDPCEGVMPVPTTFDDFECQRNVTYISGGSSLSVVNNPDVSAENSTPKVGEYNDPPSDPWAALSMGREDESPFDLSIWNQLSVKIWSAKAAPVLFKLEGGTGGQKEIWMDITTTGQWVDYVVDFSEVADLEFTRLAIFINGGVDTPDEDTYYIDEIKWTRVPYTECVTTFETELDNLGTWQYFANGDLDGERLDIVVENPQKDANNPSEYVAEFIERPGGEVFAGMFNDRLPAKVNLGTNKTVSMKVLMDHVAQVVFKLERSDNGAPNTGDTQVEYTTPGEWQTLTWDFTDLALPDGAVYTTFAIIMDFENVPTAEKRYYFDDIAIGDAQCATSSIFDVVDLEQVELAPNPVEHTLFLKNVSDYSRFEIFNLVGQKVKTIQTTNQPVVQVDVDGLDKGVYILAAYDRNGLKANAKFVKQ